MKKYIIMLGLVALMSAQASAQDDASSGVTPTKATANVRNEYAHERNLRVKGTPVRNADGTKKISDDGAEEAGGGDSMSKNGTGVFEDHHVSGVSR